MKKTLAALAATAVVVTGGTVAFAQTDTTTAPTTTAPAVEDSAPGFRGFGFSEHRGGQVLDEVLADLVAKGTITQDQSDAITGALDARRSEAQAAREATRAQLDEFWADGVLTADEIAQLPHGDAMLAADSPFADALADGQLTKDELQALRPGFGGRGHHHGFGQAGDDDTTTTTPGT